MAWIQWRLAPATKLPRASKSCCSVIHHISSPTLLFHSSQLVPIACDYEILTASPADHGEASWHWDLNIRILCRDQEVTGWYGKVNEEKWGLFRDILWCFCITLPSWSLQSLARFIPFTVTHHLNLQIYCWEKQRSPVKHDVNEDNSPDSISVGWLPWFWVTDKNGPGNLSQALLTFCRAGAMKLMDNSNHCHKFRFSSYFSRFCFMPGSALGTSHALSHWPSSKHLWQMNPSVLQMSDMTTLKRVRREGTELSNFEKQYLDWVL